MKLTRTAVVKKISNLEKSYENRRAETREAKKTLEYWKAVLDMNDKGDLEIFEESAKKTPGTP